ncbi:MAG TPA: bifunctional histidinol-phosphatase/imidazoleglycerol-phosphate dehydratase HisB [Woeseiaceae bacterium]|nr:bifunctional histidinol-phosphatase/imidazoleglycerol-phosphate dehydratase HisB [Woeseiaceae bacterium]
MRKLLFVDRDGTLIREPEDYQVDSLEKFRLVDGVIPALRRFSEAGYALVMVTNQDGLGSGDYPQAAFDRVQAFLENLFASQGIEFEAVHVCPHREHDGCDCRKPRTGLVLEYLRDGFDRERSAVVGDRETDLELAKALGVRGFKLPGPDGGGSSWDAVARDLLDAPRRSSVTRSTRETRISAAVDLDDDATQSIETGIGFFDHMLESFARHGGFSLRLECTGDLHVDEHHTVEDCALVLGQALDEALGERRGMARFGFTLPMDETLASAALDLGGRPYLVFNGKFPREAVGGLATELVPHFFRSLCDALRMNLHLDVSGENTHHMVEACFKVTGRALRQALVREGNSIPSTKGCL